MLDDASKIILVMVQMNNDTRCIMSMTDIDAFGALLIALEIDGVRRFENPKSSYCLSANNPLQIRPLIPCIHAPLPVRHRRIVDRRA